MAENERISLSDQVGRVSAGSNNPSGRVERIPQKATTKRISLLEAHTKQKRPVTDHQEANIWIGYLDGKERCYIDRNRHSADTDAAGQRA